MSKNPEPIVTLTPSGPLMAGLDLAKKAGGRAVVTDADGNAMTFVVGGEPAHAWWNEPLEPVAEAPVAQIWCDDEKPA